VGEMGRITKIEDEDDNQKIYLEMMMDDPPILPVPPIRPEWLEVLSVSTKLQKKLSKLESKLGDLFVEAASEGDLNFLKKLVTIHKVPVDVVHKSTPGFTALHLASRRGHLQSVQYLLEKKADIDKVDQKGRTAVYHAVKGNRVEVLNCLIREGAELDNHRTTTKGLTPLHKAVVKQHIECLQILIENSCNVNLQVGSIIYRKLNYAVEKKNYN